MKNRILIEALPLLLYCKKGCIYIYVDLYSGKPAIINHFIHLTHTMEKKARTNRRGWYRVRWPIRVLVKSITRIVPLLWIPVRSCISIIDTIRLAKGTTSKSDTHGFRWLNTTTILPSFVSLGMMAKHLKKRRDEKISEVVIEIRADLWEIVGLVPTYTDKKKFFPKNSQRISRHSKNPMRLVPIRTKLHETLFFSRKT